MQLRYLQTLTEIGGENNSTVIFPMPLDIVKPFLDLIAAKTPPALSLPIPNGVKAPLA